MINQAETLPLKKCGQDVIIHEKAKIINPERISIGDSVIIDDFVLIMGGAETVLGSFIHIAAFCSLLGGGRLIMEDFSGLSGGCRIYTGNEDYSGASMTNPAVPYPYRRPIRGFVRINKHAILGANSVVLPSVTIGEGAIVGANSFVSRDCEPWTVYLGAPARVFSRRPQERILELEALLRRELYADTGTYIPNSAREPGERTGE